MRSCALIAGLVLVFAASAFADGPSVTAGFLVESANPGELVTFEAKLDSADYAELELTLPETPLLSLRTDEPGPVRFDQGRFLQTHRWVFQTVASGVVRFEKLEAKVIRADGEQVVPLPAAVLTIAPYADADLSKSPVSLPAAGAVAGRGGLLRPAVFGLLFVAATAAVVFWLRLRRSRR